MADRPPTTASSAATDVEVERLLSDSVARCLQSDVPVGIFLSGGLDSSALAALAAQHGGVDRAFTLSFPHSGMDEAQHAATVAAHVGIPHTVVPVDGAQALALVTSMPQIYDEPFADPAALPLLLLSRAAGARVRVALSGEGADEIFGGYDIYRKLARAWDWARWVPGRHLFHRLAGHVPVAALDRWGQRKRRSYPGRRLKATCHRLSAENPAALLGELRSLWRGAPVAVLGVPETPRPMFWGLPQQPGRQAMFADFLNYLPDDLCVKTDRATMAHGIEARLPFLDRRLVEFAWTLPDPVGADGPVKPVLRNLLARHGLAAITRRPKHGLDVPVGAWLKGPLRDWAEDLLDPIRMRDEGYLSPADMAVCWADHKAGRRDWGNELWTILMFQAWLRHDPVSSAERVVALPAHGHVG